MYLLWRILYHWPEDDTWRTKHFDALKTHTPDVRTQLSLVVTLTQGMTKTQFSFRFPYTAPQTDYAIQHPHNSALSKLAISDAGTSEAIQHSVFRLLFYVPAQIYGRVWAYTRCSWRVRYAGLWGHITGWRIIMDISALAGETTALSRNARHQDSDAEQQSWFK